jgi:16S rRNA (cytosine967-C5)-methyltransferase
LPPRQGFSRNAPTPARRAALQLLDGVITQHQTLDNLFARSCSEGLLQKAVPRERAFARAIVATALRHLGEIDALIALFLEKPLPKDASLTHSILRNAFAELLFLNIAPHAAVDNAVMAAGKARAPTRHHKALINAVLRRASREGAERLATLDSFACNIPGWLQSRWLSAYGAEMARAIANAHLYDAPPLDITLRDESSAPHWARHLDAKILPNGGLRLTQSAPVETLPGFREGQWWIQDAAASLPARLLAPPHNAQVIDMCAAPGGKTAQLCSMGAQVFALERASLRLARLKENLKRLQLKATCIETDARLWRPEKPVSHVLLDAPCSATGTARRHPDVLRLREAEEIPALALLQGELLRAGATMLAAGGHILYCVCSLEPEEGEAIVSAFLAEHPSFTRSPIARAEVPGLEHALGRLGDLRTLPCFWPEHGGLDGFYMARLQKLR